MFNPFNPRPEHHKEQNPVIDEMMRSAARALETRQVTEEDILRSLVEDRGMDPGEAYNIVRAAAILAMPR